MYWVGGLPVLSMPRGEMDLGVVGDLLALVLLVWLLNLYNFMDGIASLEAISVCLVGALCYWLVGVRWRGFH